MFSYLNFRLKRTWRRFGRELLVIRSWSNNYLNRHIWGKWNQLGIIRRFIFGWLVIVVFCGLGLWQQGYAMLNSHIKLESIAGGQYSEGFLGKVRTLNPLLPDSAASADISKLIFSSLVRYNPKHQLEPDLALSWEISADAKVYTFHLRHNVFWHDGVPFTSQDVSFTLAAIQNPDSRSPLAPAWVGVTAEIKDDFTIAFVLPTPYAAFLGNATVGIVPRHSLELVEPINLRVADFNQHPIGTGPFRVKSFMVSDNEVALEANDQYYGGRPALDQFVFKGFDDYAKLAEAYTKKQISAISRIDPEQVAKFSKLKDIELHELSTPTEAAVFFKMNNPLLANKEVRQALIQGINKIDLINQSLDGFGTPIYGPILPGQLGYKSKYRQVDGNIEAAKKTLADAGWQINADWVLQKNKQVLKLKLVTSNSGNYPRVAEYLRVAWAKLGIDIQIVLVDKNNLQQSYIRPRNYDILLYAINVGADPDVYTYWHSSQAVDPGLNLSVYKSIIADKALENGRINLDAEVRAGKYASFQAAWQADNPALTLYSPVYVYATSSSVNGLRNLRPIEPADRFWGVEKWTARKVRIRQ